MERKNYKPATKLDRDALAKDAESACGPKAGPLYTRTKVVLLRICRAPVVIATGANVVMVFTTGTQKGVSMRLEPLSSLFF